MTALGIPNPRTADDPFTSILRSLEGSLNVSLISSPLITCDSSSLAAEVFQRPECVPIDQIPVTHESKIIGVLERSEAGTPILPARECMRPLEERMLVGATTGILTYIHLTAEPYHLVVNGNGIDGLVTPSDLLKLPVRLVLFAFLTHLEATMANAIRTRCPDDSWQRHLSRSRAAKLREVFEKGKKENVYADLLSFTQWCDKRDILAMELPEEIRGSKTEFRSDHRNLEDLRNRVMHANKYLTDASALSEMVRCAKWWIDRLGRVVEGGNDG